jgi:outer membrane lipoprotein SlyB
MSKPFVAAASLLALVALGGCTSSYSANTVDSASVGTVNRVVGGIVLSARAVTIRSEGRGVGAGVGAAAGAVGGSALGTSTREGILGGIAGAVIGGLVGSVAGDAVGNETGIEYIVRLDDGQTVTVVQGADPPLAAGQKILVVYDRRRTRVIPDGTGGAVAPQTTSAVPASGPAPAPATTSVQTVGPVLTQAVPPRR